ncbi:MAG TPA: hypothetical protein VKJ07_23835, partial [Mycobacteriales bacterium]|nr:hypothetical protein [Mycobacteriales bacterium]
NQLDVCTGTSQPPVFAYMTRYCLDANGRRLAAIRTAQPQDVASGDPTALITSYSFDDRGNLTGVADPARNRDRTAAQAIAAAAPDASPRTTYRYDGLDRRTDQIEHPNAAVDPASVVQRTNYSYDDNGNQTKTLPPRAFGSDPANQRPASADQSYATQRFYDNRDLLVAERTPAGCTAYARQQDGRVVAVTTPRGTEYHHDSPQVNCADDGPFTYYTTQYGYDGRGDLASKSIPYAPSQYGRSDAEFAGWHITYTRDDVGNAASITDARGNTFNNTYYDTGELHTTERPSWYKLDWGRNGDQSVQDPARHFTDAGSGADLQLADGGPRLTENPDRSRTAQTSADTPKLPGSNEVGNFGKVERQSLGDQLPDAGATTFSYDGDMRLQHIQDAASNQSSIGYDEAGRVTTKSWPFKGSGHAITHTYGFDPNGNLTSYDDGRTDTVGSHTTTYHYDGFDRRIDEVTPGAASGPGSLDQIPNETTKYGYDPNGNLTSRETPRGPDYTFKFEYDSFDRLKTESNPVPLSVDPPPGQPRQ